MDIMAYAVLVSSAALRACNILDIRLRTNSVASSTPQMMSSSHQPMPGAVTSALLGYLRENT